MPEVTREEAKQAIAEWLSELVALRGAVIGRVNRDKYEAILRLALAALEDAERYAYCRKGAWHRRIETVGWAGDWPFEEEWTYLLVRVPNGSDLSCGPMVDAAIDRARGVA